MSALVKVFEGHTIRVQADDESGDPWFAGKDVCEVLGYKNAAQAIRDNCDEEDISTRYTLTSGGRQELVHINESGLYALIFGSKLDGAKRFKRWVTAEVLPSIRKTGSYGDTANDNASLPPSPYDIAGKWLLRAGVDVGIAAACVMSQLEANTGTNMDAFRKALPSTTEPVGTLNATEVGKLLGLSAKATNAALAAAGLQVKSGKDWAITEAGKAHGSAYPYNRNGHSSYQLRWVPSVVEVLRGG